MVMNNTVTQANNTTVLVPQVTKQNVAIVVNVIMSAIEAAQCSLMLYDNANCKHEMKFSVKQNQTIFVQTKLFLTQGYSLRVKSNQQNTVFTAMYDLSINN